MLSSADVFYPIPAYIKDIMLANDIPERAENQFMRSLLTRLMPEGVLPPFFCQSIEDGPPDISKKKFILFFLERSSPESLSVLRKALEEKLNLEATVSKAVLPTISLDYLQARERFIPWIQGKLVTDPSLLLDSVAVHKVVLDLAAEIALRYKAPATSDDFIKSLLKMAQKKFPLSSPTKEKSAVLKFVPGVALTEAYVDGLAKLCSQVNVGVFETELYLSIEPEEARQVIAPYFNSIYKKSAWVADKKAMLPGKALPMTKIEVANAVLFHPKFKKDWDEEIVAAEMAPCFI